MRPLFLSISGINSFSDKQEIYFEQECGMFCISGPTGSGKTTILDSIVLALYGKGNRGRLSDYINLSKDRADIVLEFDSEGVVYRIERTIYKDKPSKCLLTDVTNKAVLADQVNSADQKIKGIVGLLREEFTQVALLEQGRFSEFLCADKAMRNATVGNLFRLDRFKNLYEKFNSKKSVLIERSSMLLEQCKEYSHISEEYIEELKKRQAQQKNDLLKSQKQLTACEATLEKQQKEKLQYEIIANAKQKLKTAQDSLKTLTDEIERLEKKQAEIQKYADEADKKRKAIEKNKQLMGALEALKNTDLIKANSLEKKKALQARLEKLRTQREQNQKKQQEQASSLEQISLASKKALQAAQSIYAMDVDLCRNFTLCLSSSYSNQNATLAENGTILENGSTVVGSTVDRTIVVGSIAEKASIVEDASIVELRESVAKELMGLAQKIHTITLEREKLGSEIMETEQAREKTAQTKQLYDEIWRQATKQISMLAKQADELEAQIIHQKSQLKAAQIKDTAGFLRSNLTCGDVCPVCGGVIESHFECEKTQHEEIEGRLASYESSLERIRKEQIDAQNTLANASLKIEHALEQTTQYNSTLSKAQQALTQHLKGVRDISALPSLEGILTSLQASLASAQRIDNSLKECLSFQRVSDEGIKEATEDLKQTDREIHQLSEAIEQKTGGEELARVMEKTTQKIKEDESFVERFEKSLLETAGIITQKNSEKAGIEGEIKSIRENADKELTFDPAAFVKQEKIKEELELAKSELSKAFLKTDFEIAEAVEKLQKKRNIESQLKQIVDKTDKLSLILKIIKGDRFLEFVAEEYIIRFTFAASEILAKISRGKYALEYVDGIFYVVDFLMSGQLRRVSTLSGGETFLASLALAMAITGEIAGFKSFEFFFLDEGFGTLDQDSIEIVYDALETLSKETLVGIVTHRTELVEKIPLQIKITPATESNGSQITQTF